MHLGMAAWGCLPHAIQIACRLWMEKGRAGVACKAKRPLRWQGCGVAWGTLRYMEWFRIYPNLHVAKNLV